MQAECLPQVRGNQASLKMALVGGPKGDLPSHPGSLRPLKLSLGGAASEEPTLLAHYACTPQPGPQPMGQGPLPLPAPQPKVGGHSRQLSSSEPSLQSVSPSQYQCSAIQLPSLQRNSLSEHLRMSGRCNGTAILREPHKPPS